MEEKKSKKGLIIVLVLILCVVAAVVAGVLLSKNLGKAESPKTEDKKSTGTEWEDKYVVYLKEKIDSDEYENATNGKLSFINLEELFPAMILNYENEENKVMEISVIDDEKEIKTKKYETKKENDLDVKLLYDIEEKEYKYYQHEKKKNGSETFKELKQEDIEENKDPEKENVFEFTKDQMTEKEVKEGEIPEIPDFNEKFVDVEKEIEEKDIDFDKEKSEDELLEELKDFTQEYLPKEEIITDEVKEDVDNSLKELENKKEEIKKAEEEKKKKEEEAKKKAEEEKKKKEEEAKKKAEEEANQTLKVGKYTLKYGKYVGTEGQYDGSGVTNWKVTVTLNKNGTYTIKNSNKKMGTDRSGTYKVGKLAGSDAILFDDGGGYGVLANNQLTTLAGSGATYKYQGK